MKITILKSAREDLRESFHFYEAQQKGIGIKFLESLFAEIDSLKSFAGIHSIHFGNYHRLLSKKFPFAVYYRIESNEVRVYAIVDCRKDPAWIRKRVIHH